MSERPTGHAYRLAREHILSVSDICHLCGHPGARQADHIEARSRGGLVSDVYNLAPAHGGGDAARGLDNPCPVCGRRCNQERGNKPIMRGSVRSCDW